MENAQDIIDNCNHQADYDKFVEEIRIAEHVANNLNKQEENQTWQI